MERVDMPVMRKETGAAAARLWDFASLVVALVTLVPEAAVALDPARDLHQYKHTRWTIAEGAPQSIYALVQGADGYIWIGSTTGVYRFDGVTFEPIALRVPRAETWRATALLAARDGTIWVGYENGAIATYRDGALRLDAFAPETSAFTMRFAQTGDGAIWVAAGRKGRALLRRAGGRWTEIGPNWGLPDDWIIDATATRDGSLWVTTLDAILLLRKGSTRFTRIGTPVGHAAVSEDPAGRIWLSDTRGSRILAPSAALSRSIVPTPGARRGFNTSFDRDGNLWGVNEAGIFRMRAPTSGGERVRNEQVERFTAKEGLSSDVSQSFVEDREGNIWIGTSLGLDRFRSANVIVSRDAGSQGIWGYALLGARNGNVYVGGSDGVSLIAPGARPRRIPGAGGETHDLCEGPDGSIWALQTGTALRIGAHGITRVAIPTERDWEGCVVDYANSLLLSSRTGLRILHSSGQREHLPPRRPDQLLRFLVTDQRWRPLALLASGGLVRLDDSGRAVAPLLRAGLDNVSTAYSSPRHTLFAGNLGIARVVDGRLQIVNAARFPWLTEPSGIVETLGNQTWLIGRAGIVGFLSSDLDRALTDPRAALPATILNLEDGVPNVYFREGHRDAARGGDGRLWFATIGGVVSIDPARLMRNPLPPPVAIRAITFGGMRYRDPTTMTLPSGTSQLEIQYAGLSLSIPSRVRFRYRLEGMDEDWVDAGTRREAFYTNLGAGIYRFRVMAANNDGVWNENGATLEFTIPPTFVQSVWFKLLTGLGVIGLLVALYLMRLRQVTARMQNRFDVRIAERERIARELHDTLLQGFQGLMLQIKAGVNRLPDPAARQPLDDALKRAQAVLVEGRDRVLDLRSQGAASDLARALFESAAAIADHRGPRIQINVEGAPREIHSLVLEEMQRIGEEAMRNIKQHAAASSVEVLLIWNRGGVSLAIRDDGIGVPREILDHGERTGHFGLIGMRERAERIGGRLTVTSRAGQGTEVALVVPRRAAYRNDPVRYLRSSCGILSAVRKRFL